MANSPLTRRRLLQQAAGAAAVNLLPLNVQRALAQAMIDQIHRQFIAVVKEGRGARLHETPDTFSGLFWNGEEAVDQGLADHFGSLDSVARDVVKAEDVVYTADVIDQLDYVVGVGTNGTQFGAPAYSIPANSYIDIYPADSRFDSADFLTGLASQAGAVLNIAAEIGIS